MFHLKIESLTEEETTSLKNQPRGVKPLKKSTPLNCRGVLYTFRGENLVMKSNKRRHLYKKSTNLF